MVKTLLPMIPLHEVYIEPFCGGAALFWAKSPSKVEVINDFNLMVSNFWEQVQLNFEELKHRVINTPHSEYFYQKSTAILKTPLSDNLEYAWAFWAQTNMSFGNGIFKGFAFNQDNKVAKSQSKKRKSFTSSLSQRLEGVEIFNRCALDLIKRKDGDGVFMYFDPPYAESNCGHYEKGKDIYYDLLNLLPSLKCKWLMSSYPSELLESKREQFNWNTADNQKNLRVDGRRKESKKKIECLTFNYELGQRALLF